METTKLCNMNKFRELVKNVDFEAQCARATKHDITLVNEAITYLREEYDYRLEFLKSLGYELLMEFYLDILKYDTKLVQCETIPPPPPSAPPI